jgi:hypothetical protein
MRFYYDGGVVGLADAVSFQSRAVICAGRGRVEAGRMQQYECTQVRGQKMVRRALFVCMPATFKRLID